MAKSISEKRIRALATRIDNEKTYFVNRLSADDGSTEQRLIWASKADSFEKAAAMVLEVLAS